MGKDSEKSRPEGIPEAPHPWSLTNGVDFDVLAKMDEDVILNKLGGQIEDIRKDISLNYKRLYFKNPMVKPMLIMIEEQLKAMTEALGVPKSHLVKEEKKMTFGVSKEDLK